MAPSLKLILRSLKKFLRKLLMVASIKIKSILSFSNRHYLDISNWYLKMKRGIISGHDFHNPWFGVKQDIDLFTSQNQINYSVTPSNEIFWFEK
jgi:hypothetical protein